MTDRDLDEDFAIVTGAARGIGLAIARRLHRAGAKVALLDRAESDVQKSAASLGGIAIEVDIRDSASVDAAITQAHDRLGGLSILVNNAGMGMLKPLHTYSDKEWDNILAVNLNGTFYAMRSAIPIMLEASGGVVVNNASVSASSPTRGELPYSAAKAGVIALTQGAAQEYGPAIRVNAVSPGVVRSPMTELLYQNPEVLEPVEQAIPLQRTGEVEEIADVVHFLCSDASRFMTGQNLIIDGGMSLPQAGIDDVLKWSLNMIEKTRSN
ncbi:MAG: SDR family oxidoreductase [Myxococcales bacterium]|nr:SDR family oxidoreductase [Myxococcales bacterium]